MIEIFKKIFNTKQKIYKKKNLKGIVFNYVTKVNTFGSSQDQLSLSRRQPHGSAIPFVIV